MHVVSSTIYIHACNKCWLCYSNTDPASQHEQQQQPCQQRRRQQQQRWHSTHRPFADVPPDALNKLLKGFMKFVLLQLYSLLWPTRSDGLLHRQQCSTGLPAETD